jgi:hypothetical protein
MLKNRKNSRNEQNDIQVQAELEEQIGPGLPKIPESNASDPRHTTTSTSEAGRSTRKRGRGRIVDELNLNVCLCGLVVDPSTENVVKCKRSSCETQWVSTKL